VLVYSLSSPTYAAAAPYMLRTYRDNPKVLAGAMAFWLVRTSLPVAARGR
jgi:hypothetical protein